MLFPETLSDLAKYSMTRGIVLLCVTAELVRACISDSLHFLPPIVYMLNEIKQGRTVALQPLIRFHIGKTFGVSDLTWSNSAKVGQ